jgi:broad specificity phosphatase PhoE
MSTPDSPHQAGAKTILIIRHGEKPEGALKGVKIDGSEDKDSLIPRGWQRAGALVGLFAPQQGTVRPGLSRPELLIAPEYEKHPQDRRTHQTIEPLSEELGKPIEEPFPEEKEQKLGAFVSQQTSAGVVLICWEHHRIPNIAEGIAGVTNRQDVPKEWPPQRFDLVWRFLREGSGYYFSIFPQLLLANDSHPPAA